MIVFRVSMLKRTHLYSGVRMVVNVMYFYPYPGKLAGKVKI